MLSYIEQELNKRIELFRSFDKLIPALFSFEKHARLRRNQVHDALGIKYWADKRLVNEKLVSMGIRKVCTDGKRYFVGITWKEKVKE